MVLGKFTLGLIPFDVKKISAGVVLFIAQVFVWISADLFFGAFAETARQIILIYFILWLMVRVSTGTRPAAMEVKHGGFQNFIALFLVTAVFFLVLMMVAPAFGTSAEIAIASISVAGFGYGMLHGFIKAYIEEDLFRDAIPKAGLGTIISNILFALFHLSILVMFTIPSWVAEGILPSLGAANWQYAISPVIMLFILGLIWSQVRKNYGVLGSTGSHFAYNLFALGTLGMLVGAVA